MRNLYLLLLVTGILSINSFAQVSINTVGSAPDNSAMLDVKSTIKGMLIPRITLDQRNVITSPAEGLMVFCTDCGANGGLSVYSNGAWMTFNLCISPSSTAGSNIVSPGQIIWNWTAVAGATGYKWNITASYGTAVDMGTATSKTETGIACNTTYTRFVWAYNTCGVSVMTTLSQAIPAAAPATPTEGTHVPTLTSIVWNWNTIADAIGYKWNTTTDYNTATDMGTVTTKTETGLTYGTVYTRYVWAYNGCGISTPGSLTQTTLSFTCSDPVTINHLVSGSVAPVDKTVTYGTVTNIPGETSKCWITSNLGANHQATAKDDATEASAGWYWQFNRKQGYQYTTSRIPNTTWITSITENLDWQTANDPCTLEFGNGWRIPTSTEWINVNTSGGWTNWDGPWGSGLKLHAAGGLNYSTGSLVTGTRGVQGYYWSITQNSTAEGKRLAFFNTSSSVTYSNKAYGFSLRCIRN